MALSSQKANYLSVLTLEGLDTIIKNVFTVSEATLGHWRFTINKVEIICLADATHNRMRFISPISRTSEISDQQIQKCLEANFHTALDTKYAISNNILWSVYMHPLTELQEHQVRDAVSQVYSSVMTFGSSYSSSNLIFPKQNIWIAQL